MPRLASCSCAYPYSRYSSLIGVPPRPFTMSATLSPDVNGRSDTTASSSSSTIAFALASFSRRRPGSPWMPTPISISSSPSSNSGEPLAGGVHEVSAMPMVRVTELTLLPMRISSSRSAPCSDAAPVALMTKKFPAAPPDRVGGVLHRHVVVHDQRADRDPVRLGHLLAHLEGHPVTGVVVDDVQHALGRVEQLARLEHVVHRRRGEHVARARGVEHALADDHDVRGLVAGPGALDDRDLV